jgi:arabinose-5-phosphate isomerase
MMRKKLGLTLVADANGKVLGILTDGDLRRLLAARDSLDLSAVRVREVMTPGPRSIRADALVAEAVREMEGNPKGAITALVVLDPAGRAEGIVHLHDCLRLERTP